MNMDEGQFARNLSFAYIAEGVEADDIEKMLHRGFLKVDFYNAYMSNKQGFLEKYEIFKETENMLTSGELFEYLDKNIENLPEIIPLPSTIDAMAEAGLFSEEECREITLAADATASTQSKDVKDQVLVAQLTKQYRLFFYNKDAFSNLTFEQLKERVELLPEPEQEQEVDGEAEMGDKPDEEPENDKDSEKTSLSEEKSSEELQEEPVYTEVIEHPGPKKKTKSSPKQEPVVIPLSEGYIVVGTSADGSAPEYTVPDNLPSNSALLSKNGLYEVVDYVKKQAPDEELQIIKYSSDGSKSEILYGTGKNGELIGDLQTFEVAYAEGKNIPEYSEEVKAVDSEILCKLGATDYSDGSHDSEFVVQKDETTGETTVHWLAPEYTIGASATVIESAIERAEEILHQSPEYSPQSSEDSSSFTEQAEKRENSENKAGYPDKPAEPVQAEPETSVLNNNENIIATPETPAAAVIKHDSVVIDFQPSENKSSELNNTVFSIPAYEFIEKAEEHRTAENPAPFTFESLGFESVTEETVSDAEPGKRIYGWAGKVVTVPAADGSYITIATKDATEEQIKESIEYIRQTFSSSEQNKEDPYSSPISSGKLSETALIGIVETVKSNIGEEGEIQLLKTDSSGKQPEILFEESEGGLMPYGEVISAYYGEEEHITSSDSDKADLFAIGAISSKEIKDNINITDNGDIPVVNITVPEGVEINGAYYALALEEAREAFAESLIGDKSSDAADFDILFSVTTENEEGEKETVGITADDVYKDLTPIQPEKDISVNPEEHGDEPFGTDNSGGGFTDIDSDPYDSPVYAAAGWSDGFDPYESILEPGKPRVLVALRDDDIEMSVDGLSEDLFEEQLYGDDLKRVTVPKLEALETLNVAVTRLDANGNEIVTEIKIEPDNTTTIKTIGESSEGEIEFSDFTTDLLEDPKELSTTEKLAGFAALMKSASISSGMVVTTEDGFEMEFDPEWLELNAPDLDKVQKNFDIHTTTVSGKTFAYELLKTLHKAQEMGYTGEQTQELVAEEFPDFDNLDDLLPNRLHPRELTEEQRENLFVQRLALANKATREKYKSKFDHSFSFIAANTFFQSMGDTDFGVGASTIRNAVRTAGMVMSLSPLISKSEEMDTFANKQFAVQLFDKYQDITLPADSTDAVQKIDMHSARGRREAIKNVENKVKQSRVLNRAGVHKMTRDQLKKIMATGKIADVALNSQELNIVNELLILKGVQSGDLEAAQSLEMLNSIYGLKSYGIDLSKYNISNVQDIHKIINDIDMLSIDEKFSESLGGVPISLLSDKKLAEILENKETPQEVKDLINAHTHLKAFEKQKTIAKQQKRSAKSTLRYLLIRGLQGTELGTGVSYLRQRYRIARAIGHVLYLVQSMITQHALVRQVKRMQDASNWYNNTKFGQWTNRRLRDRLQNGTKTEQTIRKVKEKKNELDKKLNDKLAKKKAEQKAKLTAKKNDAAIRAKNTKAGRKIVTARGKLQASRAGRAAGKVSAKVSSIGAKLKAAREIEIFDLGAVFTKISSIKAGLNKIALVAAKYLVIALVCLSLLQVGVTLMGMVADSVTGILYSKTTTGSDDGDTQEYEELSAEDSLIGDRIEFCIAMDNSLRAYIDSFYDNTDLIDTLVNNKKELADEETKWYDPISDSTLKGSLKSLGTKINGISVGNHISYYDFDGNPTTSFKSNAKAIVSVANSYIGTDLSCKGLYKAYSEYLYTFTHAIGYALRSDNGKTYIYSCDSHSTSGEHHNSIVTYYCNGTDTVSKNIYDAANDSEGSSLHNGLDIEVDYNDADGTITLGETIGTSTDAKGDENIQARKDNVADQDSSYTGGNTVSGNFTYEAAGEDGIEYLNYDAPVESGSSYGTTSISGSPGATYSTDGKTVTFQADMGGSTQTFTDKGSEGTRDEIYKYITETMGLNKAAAAGIIGNMYVESNNYKQNKSFDYTLIERYGGYYYSSLCMWQKSGTVGDLAYQYAQSGDLMAVLQLLNKSINNGYSGYNYGNVLSQLKSVPNTEAGAIKAAELFCVYYENCPGTSYAGNKTSASYSTPYGTKAAGSYYQGLAARKDAASAYFNYYNNLTGSPNVTSSSTGTTTESTTASGYESLVFPLKGSYSITCGYGTYSNGSGHPGTDFVSSNTTIYSVSDGKVLCAFNDTVKGSTAHGKFGNVICIESVVGGDTVRFLYAHTSYTLVSAGDTVTAGTPIGVIGDTGNTTGPHLHLEVRICKTDGTFIRVNPIKYLTSGEKSTAGCPQSSYLTSYDPSSVAASGSETGSGITGGYSGGYTAGTYAGTVSVAALYRADVSSIYGDSEQGSWLWVESSNGCERHSITYCTGSGTDVTGEVLSYISDSNIDLSTLGIDNRTTLHPESTIFNLHFYSSSAGFSSGCPKSITYATYSSKGEVVTKTAYYCPGHIDSDCKESDSVTVNLTHNTKHEHTSSAGAMTCYSPIAGTNKTFCNAGSLTGCDRLETVNCNTKTSTSTHVAGVPAGTKCIAEMLHQSSTTATYTGSCKNYTIKSGTYYCTSSHKISGSQLSSCGNYEKVYDHYQSGYSNSGYLGYYIAYKDGRANIQDPAMNTGCSSAVWKVVADNSEYTYYNLYCSSYHYECKSHTDFIVVCNSHERCLGEIVQSSSGLNITLNYCLGWCPSHQVASLCTGHLSLDIAQCTAYNSEDMTNTIMSLGVPKTVDVTEEEYKPREENGYSSGDKVTVETYSSDSEDIDDYIFDYSATPNVQKNLSKYVFKDDDGEYLLPKYTSELENSIVKNAGSLVKGKALTNGLKYLKSFIDGSFMIKSHMHDEDKDGIISLSDVIGEYSIYSQSESFYDINDDISLHISLKNIQSVSSKFGKEHFSSGFYTYVVDSTGTKASIKKINGEYVSNENYSRAIENEKEDWYELYEGITFPGSYNTVSTDEENQEWSYSIAYATAKAVNYTASDYLFLPSIYSFPTKEEAEKGIPGSGFISAYEGGVKKVENALGLPSKMEATGRQDSVDFALSWASTFYGDLSSLSHKDYSTQAYTTLLNLLGGNIESYKNQYLEYKANGSKDTDIPQWILDVYSNNVEKARDAYAQMVEDDTGNYLTRLKTMYIRKYLMNQGSSFVNGAKTDETTFTDKLTDLKCGDILSIDDELYLVLYNTSDLHPVLGLKSDGTPYYDATTTNGADKGKVILLSVSSQSSDDTTTDVIHCFAYTIELLQVKKNNVFLWSE